MDGSRSLLDRAAIIPIAVCALLFGSTVGVMAQSADPSAAAEVNAVARMMEHTFTRAMHDGEPSTDDKAIARVIGDVWLSNLVAWVTRRASADDVSSHLELAARLLLR